MVDWKILPIIIESLFKFAVLDMPLVEKRISVAVFYCRRPNIGMLFDITFSGFLSVFLWLRIKSLNFFELSGNSVLSLVSMGDFCFSVPTVMLLN